MTGPPRDAAGNLVQGSCCGTELRPVSMTAEGVTYRCDCGRTTWTYLSQGELDLRPKPPATDQGIAGSGQKGC